MSGTEKSEPGVRVTVTDLATGESESKEIMDDFIVVCVGNRYIANQQFYPVKGTVVLTIKTDRGDDA